MAGQALIDARPEGYEAVGTGRRTTSKGGLSVDAGLGGGHVEERKVACVQRRMAHQLQQASQGRRKKRKESRGKPGNERRTQVNAFLRLLATGGGLLDGKGVLLAHGGDDSDEDVLSVVKHLLDLVADLSLGDLYVVLGDTLVGHEVEEAVVDVDELVFDTDDVGDIHVVGGRREIFELLVGEDVDGNQVDLCVSVLAGLGGRHVDNLARAALNDDVAVLSEGRALERVGERSSGGGSLESLVMLLVSHCKGRVKGVGLKGGWMSPCTLR